VCRLGIENDFGNPSIDMVWGWKVKGQGHRVNTCIFHLIGWSITQKTNDPKVLKLSTAIGLRRGFELYECLLVLYCTLKRILFTVKNVVFNGFLMSALTLCVCLIAAAALSDFCFFSCVLYKFYYFLTYLLTYLFTATVLYRACDDLSHYKCH